MRNPNDLAGSFPPHLIAITRKPDLFLLHIDLLHVASLCDKRSSTEPQEVFLRCFSVSCGGGWSNHETTILNDLPLCCKPPDGNGILINVKGKERWQPFASSSIKILCKCLTEGTLYVEGLLEISSVLSACTLLCYGDVDVHMVGTSIASYLAFFITCFVVIHNFSLEALYSLAFLV